MRMLARDIFLGPGAGYEAKVRPFATMERLVICTGNAGKLTEMRALLPKTIVLVSLADLGVFDELPETGDSLEENALQKARTIHLRTGLPCLADDTGLEVAALGDAPGVYSARYAGKMSTTEDNITKLLNEMAGVADRKAKFRTVLALVSENEEELFQGMVHGSITLEPRGQGGFGYDPVFLPEGHELTFAEMDSQTKNSFSHRSRAVSEMVHYIRRHYA